MVVSRSTVCVPAIERGTMGRSWLSGSMSRVVQRLAQPVDGAAGCGGRRVFARAVVLAVQCEGGEAGGGLADATGALGVALLGTAVTVFGVRAAVVAGLEDLKGLFEGRHGGGCVCGGLAVVPSFEISCWCCYFTLRSGSGGTEEGTGAGSWELRAESADNASARGAMRVEGVCLVEGQKGQRDGGTEEEASSKRVSCGLERAQRHGSRAREQVILYYWWLRRSDNNLSNADCDDQDCSLHTSDAGVLCHT